MRLPAEWEKQKALLISYPHENSDWQPYLNEIREFYDEFINIVKKYQNLIILSPEPLNIKTSKSDFEVKIIKVKTNDTWVRDYGPISVEISKSDFELKDFTFNGWGLKYSANYDNLVNRRVFHTKKIGFVLEGGSIDSNGEGVLLTTSKCLLEENRNPHLSKEEIETKLKNFFGLKKVLWLNHGFLEGDDTDSHIDMLARFVAPNKIVYITCDDKDDIHYDELKKMEKELKRYGFDLIPLPFVSPKYFNNKRLPASYANFVIINSAVIVPTYNDTNDKEALKIFKKLFSNRDIIGLDSSTLIKEHGSIHCSCMNIF
ncbi:agmatine deiminase family protein [Nitrosophilus kaiyonis]|uniref:agmatine deiminase family protein n=1 Tax=Nitrosophilus kaiyonis TaxID=2930200 RepID=UPI002492E11B|nr:agmatine deiminase family protein [Nitrosophilus kaiyonis]